MRGQLLGVICAAILAASCGGSDSSPTTPTPATPASPQVAIEVSPNPLVAQLKTGGPSSSTYELSAAVTFRETGGAAGRITRVTGTIMRSPSGGSTGGGLDVLLSFAARGSVTDSYTQQFDVSDGVESVVWRVSASGVDAQGRAFNTSSVDIPVQPPTRAAPASGGGGAARLELWGGASYGTFLGCWSCNQFAADSVFNEFGRHGSRFSSTSIWNHFSQYGSQFATYSACNEFTSTPPRLLNTASNTYQELTLNQFRPFAIRDTAVVAYLRAVICER